MRVVPDTNVIISSYLTPEGRVARILQLWGRSVFELTVSEAMLDEYNRVLHYPRHRRVHRLTDEQLADVIAAFREFATNVTANETPRIVHDDPDDDHILACAVRWQC